MQVVQIIILALAILLNYAESSPSSSGNHIPEPANDVLPSNFFYADGTIHDRNHPNAHPFVVDLYFLGMEQDLDFYPIFNDNLYRIYSFRDHRLIEVTSDQRFRLMQGRPLALPRRGRPPLERPTQRHSQRRNPPQRQIPIPQVATHDWFDEPGAFSGLPARYFYADGALHEHGRPNSRPLIVQNYFFGMIDYSGFIHPVDSSNPYHVYSLIARTMVRITPEVRNHLLHEVY